MTLDSLDEDKEQITRNTPRKFSTFKKDLAQTTNSAGKACTFRQTDQSSKIIIDAPKVIYKILNWLFDDATFGLDAWKIIGGKETLFAEIIRIKKFIESKNNATREFSKELKNMNERDQLAMTLEFVLGIIQECIDKRSN